MLCGCVIIELKVAHRCRILCTGSALLGLRMSLYNIYKIERVRKEIPASHATQPSHAEADCAALYDPAGHEWDSQPAYKHRYI